MCEYCDGSKKPIIDVDGDGFDGGIAKVVGAELLVNWGDRLDRKGPMFVFGINNCPMCGRELRSGTCENIAPDYLDFLCSECGFVHYHSDENDTGDGNDWTYCPNCGKAVKR